MIEGLGVFYLGKEAGSGEALLYDSKDLTTHAVCVGMTGSGKTGLCICLLEEAALDGIPAIAIDPKGDLGNLLLTFPGLRPEEFRPWIDEAEAARRGVTPDQLATSTAEAWKKGLAESGQDAARIKRLRAAADLAIYTPGSPAGIPLAVLKSFAAPPGAILEDEEALRERVSAAAAGLLTLVGIDADPLRSREHILLANLLERAWRAGRSVEIASLVREIQSPPFERVGVLDLESFFPAKERLGLSLALNNLLASSGSAAWLEGEPLDVARLLWTAEGKPRLSIVSIAHLSDAERMFFVTLLLNEVSAWMRAQPGTSSLRAILYMDEIFGFFPPSANPPSKTPMLRLLKQARAYGLGVVLATQNPVDLDYKGLSNAGTWLLGRLQTERDKLRVLDGLEGASTASGARFDRAKLEATLSGLASRTFLMNNVHEDEPVLFQSRWSLSYLRGPLTKAQIQTLMKGRTAAPPAPERAPALHATSSSRAVAPPEASEGFLAKRAALGKGERFVYRPALAGSARIHYVQAKGGIDAWEEISLLAALEGDAAWETSRPFERSSVEVAREPEDGIGFAELPAAAARGKSYAAWSKSLSDHLYRTRSLVLWSCPSLRQTSKAGESEGDFRIRLGQLAREGRDARIEELRKRHAPKLVALRERLRKAEERVGREQSQSQHQTVQTMISVGATVLGVLLGRKFASTATTAARGVDRSMREREDVGRAAESAEDLRKQLAELEETLAAELRDECDPARLGLEKLEVRPRKADLSVTSLNLLWIPWRVAPDGTAEPAWS